MAHRKPLTIVLSVLVTVGLLAWLFASIPLRELVDSLRTIRIPGVLLYLVLGLAATFLKAARSKWLLAPVRISWPDMFLVTFVRNGFEDLLPARLGSLSYVVVLNNNLGLPFEAAASTLVIMLVFDFLTLSPFVIAAVLLAPAASSALPFPLLIGFALAYFLIVLGLAWKIVPVTRLVVGWARRAFRFLGGEKHPKARHALDKLDETVMALSSIKSRSIAVPLFLISSVIRFLKYLSLYALLLAILHSRGIGAAELALWKIILAITAAELTSILPVKGIADFGTWESAWVLAFALMGIDRATAVLSGFSLHLVTNLFEYGFAALALLVLSIRRKRLQSD
jgi:uncharacterized membrane protein YbhN (UPF0104 family)